MSSKILVANWKMNGTLTSSLDYFETLFKNLEKPLGNQILALGGEKEPKGLLPENVIFCPPHPYLLALQGRLVEKGFSLGAQDCAAHETGAYTGAVSALMLKDVGVSYVLIGHSERRQNFNETNDMCRHKIQHACAAGLSVIYCIGETEEERDAGHLEDVLNAQLEQGFSSTLSSSSQKIMIAYEPVWAIGTGRIPKYVEIEATHGLIKALLRKKGFDFDIPVLYGGSVKGDNAKGILSLPQVDGALIGGASLDPLSMEEIMAATKHL